MIPHSFGDTEDSTILLKKLTILASVFLALENTIEQCFNEIFASTSSALLDRWETLLNLPLADGTPDDQRQSRIIGKLRGTGTCTSALLKNIAEAYSNGECDVIENPSQYNFTVKFNGNLGIPPNLSDLQKTIEEVKPAHLQVLYAFSYLLINNIDQVMTINQLQATPLSDFAGGE
jgi:hypothetical protein